MARALDSRRHQRRLGSHWVVDRDVAQRLKGLLTVSFRGRKLAHSSQSSGVLDRRDSSRNWRERAAAIRPALKSDSASSQTRLGSSGTRRR